MTKDGCPMEIRLPKVEADRIANVTKPNPPIWTSTITTILPQKVRVVETSKILSPVTVTADVAAKRASNQLMRVVVEKGIFRKNVPARINTKKPSASILGGLACTCCL